MNISEAFDFLNFWINKKLNAWYTIPELTLLVDRGQISYYSDIQPKYATSQRVKDALAPFRGTYNFGFNDTVDGIITIPPSTNYLDLLDVSVFYTISARNMIRQVPIGLVNEDERADKLNSQIDPVTITSPIGEMIGSGVIQLYPQVQYQGKVTYLRRPVAPVFAYTVISGRVIVYDPANSVQLEWRETDQNAVLMKALSSIGVNLSDQEVSQYAELKTQSNFQGVNRV